MVSLAKSLKDEPFHMIASYCQRGTKESTLASLARHGWKKDLENTSVMFQSTFPKAPIKYVPYYLIFDHTGKLRYNHMAGRFHGGDGDTYQKLVKKLLKEVPKKRG